MKTKTISAVITFAALTAAAGTTFAGSHDSYYRAFYGEAEATAQTAGKAAYGTPSGSAWDGHEAYRRALGSDSVAGGSADTMGKAAFGTASGPDGHAIYRSVFGND